MTQAIPGTDIEVPSTTRTGAAAGPVPEDPIGNRRAPDAETSPLRDVVVEDHVPFDMGGLHIGAPSLPRPSNDDF